MHNPPALGRFALDVPLDKIQWIRLCASLLESDFDVHFPPAAAPVLEAWNHFFGIKYHLGLEGVPLLRDVSIDHAAPLCTVGAESRPLIFPHAMLGRCRSKWADERPVRFSFSGLVTAERRACLESWVRACFGEAGQGVSIPRTPTHDNFQLAGVARLQKAFYRLLGRNFEKRTEIREIGLVIDSSDRGRRFPVKVWDDEYFDLMARSRFVVCPNGTFVWTYRFFESALCGAIPIVEDDCGLYDGFVFYRMSDPVAKLTWTPEIAEHNFRQAERLLTIPPEDLNRALARTLAGSERDGGAEAGP